MDEDEKREQSAAARVGVDYAIKLSYVAVDKSDRISAILFTVWFVSGACSTKFTQPNPTLS